MSTPLRLYIQKVPVMHLSKASNWSVEQEQSEMAFRVLCFVQDFVVMVVVFCFVGVCFFLFAWREHGKVFYLDGMRKWGKRWEQYHLVSMFKTVKNSVPNILQRHVTVHKTILQKAEWRIQLAHLPWSYPLLTGSGRDTVYVLRGLTRQTKKKEQRSHV